MRAKLLTVAAMGLAMGIMPVTGPTAAAAATSAQAGSVGPNGRIAFASYEWCCDYDIYAVGPDGTGLVNLTQTAEVSETQPVWSPDGTQIAYTRRETGPDGESGTDVFVMGADGSGQTPVTTDPGEEFVGDWSPDGTRIVYSAYVEGESITSQSDVFVIGVDGSGQTNITNADTDETTPSWSPDGDRLVFAAVRPSPGEEWYRWELVTTDPDGGNETQLTTANDIGGESYEDHNPSWDPTGEMIVWMAQYDEECCGDWDVWAMNEDGSGKTNLTDDGDAWLGFSDWFPSWSPDGTEITFSSNRVDGWSQTVFAMPAPAQLPPPAAASPSAQVSSADQEAVAASGPPVSDDGARPVVRAGTVSGLSWGTAQTAAVTVSRSGTGTGRVTSADGGISCGRDCSESYPVGQAVKLRARPASGSVFAGWGGACAGTAATCTVTVDELNSVRARFTRSP